jgi:hypothetical protein
MDPALLQMLSQARDVKLVIDGVAFALLPEALAGMVQVDTAPLPSPNTFHLSGKVWVIQFDGRECHLPDTPRMRYLHALLKHQGRKVWCSDLIDMARGEAKHDLLDEQVKELIARGEVRTGYELRIDRLPPDARRRLLNEIEQLEGEADALRHKGQVNEAIQIAEVIANVKAQLNRDRIKGRNVTFRDGLNKNRDLVRAGIRRAIKAIETFNPPLARHLTNAVKTGFQCCYQPEKEIFWVLSQPDTPSRK